MRLEVNRSNRSVEIINEMAGEKISWNISAYDKTRFANVEEPFREINRFIASRDHVDQQKLWMAYVEANDVICRVKDPVKLRDGLTDVIKKIYDIVTMEKMHNWAWKGMTATFPSSEEFEDPDPDHPEEGTYGRAAYSDLLVLSIALQLMIPLWGEYMGRINYSAGRALKELAAFELLSKAEGILHCPAMVKLINYVDHFLSTATVSPQSASLTGLTANRLPEWLLGSIVVRRLAIGEVDASPERGHLVSNIYTSMTGLVRDLDRKSGGRFRAVDTAAETSRDDGNTTIADLINARQDLSAGQMTIYESAIVRFVELAKQIEPNITKKMVRECVNKSVHRQHLTRDLFHETICQYVTDGIISAQVIPRLDPHLFMVLSGVCQAVLWHRGHVEIAVYLTATGVSLTSDTASGIDIKVRPSTKTVDRLIELYPVSQPAWSAPVDGGVDRRNNVAVKAIRAVAGNLIQFSFYQAECPDELWNDFPMEIASRKIPVVNDIAECLGRLLIEIQEGAENNERNADPG